MTTLKILRGILLASVLVCLATVGAASLPLGPTLGNWLLAVALGSMLFLIISAAMCVIVQASDAMKRWKASGGSM